MSKKGTSKRSQTIDRFLSQKKGNPELPNHQKKTNSESIEFNNKGNQKYGE